MNLKLVRECASLLDKSRYDEASQFLAEDCTYHYSEGNYQGRKNIINIYRLNDLQWKKIFDETQYTSAVEETEDGNYRIDFADKIRKGHRWHEYRSFQLIKCNDDRITHIEHSEIPGEMDSLRMFFSRPGSDDLNLE